MKTLFPLRGFSNDTRARGGRRVGQSSILLQKLPFKTSEPMIDFIDNYIISAYRSGFIFLLASAVENLSKPNHPLRT